MRGWPRPDADCRHHQTRWRAWSTPRGLQRRLPPPGFFGEFRSWGQYGVEDVQVLVEQYLVLKTGLEAERDVGAVRDDHEAFAIRLGRFWMGTIWKDGKDGTCGGANRSLKPLPMLRILR